MAFDSVLAKILCCMCGVEINQNAANMCLNCIKDNFDVTSEINKQLTIHSCRSCNRFLLPPWSDVKLESKELLTACLRKISGLNKVKLIDAAWIWTEPHSMRLKIKLTVQKEIMNGAVLQQACIVDFTIRNQQCQNCQSSFAQGAWQAVVQVRQRVSHKRTFFFLEQLLLKHRAHSECIRIVTFKDGIDFYFTHKQHALRFIVFLQAHVPIKSDYSRKLISADHKSNIGKFKHNHIVEIVPICKDDLLFLPADLARNLSDISPLVTVKAIGAGIHVVDPLTGERQEIDVDKYWRYSFSPAMSGRDLVPFIVLSIEPILHSVRVSAKKRGHDKKMRLAEIVVVRESDFGINDTQYTCLSHLGNILREGDTVMGFDLASFSMQSTDKELENSKMKAALPDVILVRKVYSSKGDRNWTLKNLQYDNENEGDAGGATGKSAREVDVVEQDYELFLQEVEGDREMRANINLYKTASSQLRNDSSATMSTESTPIQAKGLSSKKKRAIKRSKLDSKIGTNLRNKICGRKSSDGDNKNDADVDDEVWEDYEGDDNEDDTKDVIDDEAIRLEELLEDLTINFGDSNALTLIDENSVSAIRDNQFLVEDT